LRTARANVGRIISSIKKAELEKRGVLANWIEINLAKIPNILKTLTEHFPMPANTQGSPV